MCISAGASFGASAILGVAGILAVRKSTAPSQLLFAAIPLLFSVQQFTEGLVWLSLTNPDYRAWENNAVYSFLFFAEVLWPAWGPLAILFLEKNPRRKIQLRALTGMGICVSLCFAYSLAWYPVQTSLASHHIRYAQNFPLARLWFSVIFYILPTVAPWFISTTKGLWLMGLSILLSYAMAQMLFPNDLISIWCFFAALLSLEVLWILRSSPAPANAVLTRTRPSY